MRPLQLVAVTLALALAAASLPADEYLHQRLRASLVVADPEAASARIATWAERVGGYFLVQSTDRVVIRVPNERLPELRSLLQEVAEEILELSPEAVDLREDMLGLHSAVRSREEILSRNLAFLDRADVAGTLAIEKEVTGLLEEIEGTKGRLRRLEVDRRLARSEIDFSFLEQSLPADIPSSFQWINTVDFYRFVGEDLR